MSKCAIIIGREQFPKCADFGTKTYPLSWVEVGRGNEVKLYTACLKCTSLLNMPTFRAVESGTQKCRIHF